MKRIIPIVMTFIMLLTGIPVYAGTTDSAGAFDNDKNPQATANANSWRYHNGQPILSDHNTSSQNVKATPTHPDATRVGIDVSEFQDTINWDKVRASGIDFAIIRCGYGDNLYDEKKGKWLQDDSEFKRNISECERLGIPYGVYIYSYATNKEMALSEAEHVLRLMKGHIPSYPIYYDMEDDSTLKAKAKFPAIAKTFCDKITDAGYSVGVYANLTWWDKYLTDPVFDNWHKWVAQYYKTCQYDKPYAIWQYTSSGKVNGIVGNVDMNYLIGYPKNHGSSVESTSRIWGQNRYDTAINIADELKASMSIDKFDTAVIACGKNYPDALSGSYLSKVKSAPILLVGDDSKSQKKVLDYMNSNVTAGSQIYLLGGTTAISKEFENKLSEYAVKRLGGNTRYDTNLAILAEADVEDQDIMICSGLGYADSLSASAVGNPILLVDKNLSNKQKAYLESLYSDNFYLIGGKSVVSSTVSNQCKSYGTVKRIWGSDRYKTSVAVANEFFNDGVNTVILAYALNFPDGLCGGPLGIAQKAPLILTSNSNYMQARHCIQNLMSKNVITLGGTSLISEKTVTNIVK